MKHRLFFIVVSVHILRIFLRSQQTSTLNFLVIGDWGKGGLDGQTVSKRRRLLENRQDERDRRGKQKTHQMRLASAMANYSETTNLNASFVVALGDNFYMNGVPSSNSSFWNSLWSDVYLRHKCLRVKWYAVLGNHDYGYQARGVRAQIERTYIDTETLWTMPATNYSQRFNIDNTNSVHIIFIDTTTLAPSENDCCNQKGGVSQETQWSLIENQLQHIERMLKDATAELPTWLLVAGHYPIYSSGPQGDTNELIKYLLPLLVRYNVHAYLCGHDHISEHLYANNTNFYVFGAGSMIDYLGDDSVARLVWSGTGYGAFGAVRVNSNEMIIRIINISGVEVYSHTLTNPFLRSNSNQNQNEDQYSNNHIEKRRQRLVIFTGLALSFAAAIVMLLAYSRSGSKAAKVLVLPSREIEEGKKALLSEDTDGPAPPTDHKRTHDSVNPLTPRKHTIRSKKSLRQNHFKAKTMFI